MKKIIIALSIFFALGLTNFSSAQNINININLDKQPAWGPTGYDYAGYYYLPEINVYYDVASSIFYYLSGSNWISSQYLPDKYRKYDLYNMYKVVINESQPWQNNKNHKKTYSQYKGDKTQEVIRNSNNSKYNTSKNNNRSWVDTNRNSNTNNNNKQQTNNNKNQSNNQKENSKKQSNNNKNNQAGEKRK